MRGPQSVLRVLAILGAVSPSCAKNPAPAPKPAPEPAAPVAEEPPPPLPPPPIGEFPAHTIAWLRVAEPSKALERLRVFVDAVDPEAGKVVAAWGTAIPGVDLTQPIDVLVFNAQQFSPPIAVVATVTDAAAIDSMLTPMSLSRETIGARTLVGSESVRANVRPWVSRPAPAPAGAADDLRLEIDEDTLRAMYPDYKQLLMTATSGADASKAAFLPFVFTMLEDFAGQVDDVDMSVKFEGTSANLVLAASAVSDSVLAKFIADQQGIEAPFSLLRRAQGPSASALVGGGRYRWDTSKAGITQWSAKVLNAFVAIPQAEAERIVGLWIELLGGPIVMLADMDGMLFRGAYAFEFQDETRAKAIVDEVSHALYSKTWTVPGLTTFEGKGCKPRKRSGLELLACKGRSTIDPSIQIPGHPSVQEFDTVTLVDGGMVYMSIGDEKRLFELRRQLSSAESTPAPEIPGLEQAESHGETFYVRYDLAKIMASALAQQGKRAPKHEPANLQYTTGAKDERAWLRMSVGAQDIQALQKLTESASPSASSSGPK